MDSEVKILFVDFVGFERTVKVMSYAKGLVAKGNHPIWNAIKNLDDRIETANVENVKEFNDLGIEGKVGNDKVIIGNEKVMRECNIELKGDTQNKIFFAINFQVQAVFKLG